MPVPSFMETPQPLHMTIFQQKEMMCFHGGLYPCINYWGFNRITVCNRYPLPLTATAFELLQGASILTKLDLGNTYHLLQCSQGNGWKTAFNTPTDRYEYLVMPFDLTWLCSKPLLMMCSGICSTSLRSSTWMTFSSFRPVPKIIHSMTEESSNIFSITTCFWSLLNLSGCFHLCLVFQ